MVVFSKLNLLYNKNTVQGNNTMLESALYARLRPKLQQFGSVDRVENTTGSGMWDVHLCCSGVHNWVETKMVRAGKLHFERYQLSFARRLTRAGATNLFVIASLDARDGHMDVYHASTLLAAPREIDRKWHVIRPEDLEPCLTMSKPYDWDALRQLLSSPYTRHLDTGYTEPV